MVIGHYGGRAVKTSSELSAEPLEEFGACKHTQPAGRALLGTAIASSTHAGPLGHRARTLRLAFGVCNSCVASTCAVS